MFDALYRLSASIPRVLHHIKTKLQKKPTEKERACAIEMEQILPSAAAGTHNVLYVPAAQDAVDALVSGGSDAQGEDDTQGKCKY